MGGWGHHMMSRAEAWPHWENPLIRPLLPILTSDMKDNTCTEYALCIGKGLLDVIRLSIHSLNGYIHDDLICLHQQSHWNKTR